MRTILLAAAFAAAAITAAVAQTPAPTAPTPDAVQQVYRCADTTDDAQRLACYDAAVGQLRSAQQTGELAVIDRAGAAVVDRESFGFSLPNLARLLPFGGDRDESSAEQPQEQTFTIERIVEGRERNTFVMSNGQIWVQSETRSARHVRVGHHVTIRRAAMGSFMLVPERGGAGLRVRRQE